MQTPLVFALAALVAAFPVLGRERVLEDTPTQLILEIQVPAFHVEAGAGGDRVSADGFMNTLKAGAPDLPWYTFEIASGIDAPSVSVVPEQWVQLPLTQSLAGVERWVTPSSAQVYRDTLSFQAARGPATQISGIKYYRGMPLRSIGLSLGSYVPGSKSIRMMKRFRVQVTFSGARSSPNLNAGQWLRRAGVKNVAGGPYLVSLSVSRPLAKAGARAIATLGTTYLKIQIGDQQVDGFAEDGVYSISYATAVAMAPGLTGIMGARVTNLRMYAGPKDTLPASLSSPLLPTLQEIPIEIVDSDGNDDNSGTFGPGWQIKFYAHGTSVWKPIPGATGPIQWKFGSDPYSFYNYYYLDWSGNVTGSPPPLRLATDTTHAAPAQTVTAAPHYLRAEHDLATGSCNPSNVFDNQTGFDWWWYYKGQPCNTSGVASMTLNALQLQSTTVDTLQGYTGDTAFIGMFNYSGTPEQDFGVFAGLGGSQLVYDTNLTQSLGAGSWYIEPLLPEQGNTQLGFDSVEWGGPDPRFEGYTVRYTRTLDTSQNRIVFPAAEGEWVAYQIAGGANLLCLRVDTGVGTRWIPVQNVNGNGVFTDSVGNGADVQYFLYRTAQNLNSSVVVSEQMRSEGAVISNYQSIGSPQYLIVAPDALIPDALTLQSYRETSPKSVPPNLSTSIIRTEDIYREWSGGRLSPMAIRDALQYILSKNSSLHYVLLYGDGHYDYRNIINSASSSPKPNYIPPFNWDDPNNPTNPLSSDDFYGVLDSASGDWKNGNALLDVAMGRLSVQTSAQAEDYFAKMQQYEEPSTAGEWRGQITLTADDATQVGQPNNIDPVCQEGPGYCHTDESESFAQYILAEEPGIMMQKIYLFDYTANAVGQKPEAATDLITSLNQGALFFSFFGHGAYNQLADEVLMQTTDALSRLRNANLAFMAAIFSCTVGRFDLLSDEGMLEQFVRQQAYGAIVGFGAARESYPPQNLGLGEQLAERLFLPEVDSVPLVGVGDAVENAKNFLKLAPPSYYSDGTYNLNKYTLLGEPVVEIRRPGPTIELDSAPATLSPLQCGTIRGKILGGSGSGNVSVRILGGDVLKSYPYLAYVNPITDFTDTALKPGPILFERTVPYKDSVFSMSYFLPKEVPAGDTGKMQIFAWDAVNPLENTHAVTGLLISAVQPPVSSCTPQNSGTGPQITVTGCNTNESGGANFPDQVNISLPYCLQIDVTDSTAGILSGDGPDEGTTVGITGVIDPYHPTPSVDDLYHKSYQLTLENGELSAGTYQLTVTARDGFNNLSERQVSLITSTDSALTFLKAFNAPNPVKRAGTTFYFSTTLPQDEAQVVTASGGLQAPNTNRITFDLRIFNQLGNMVREFPDASATGTFWDGTDAWGQRLGNGVYFYQVTGTWSTSNGAPGQQGVQQSQRNILVLSR